MKEILKKWCETNTIGIDDAPLLIKEYYRLYYNQDILDSDIDKLMIVHKAGIFPIDWEYILNAVAVKQSDCYIESLYDHNHILLKRYFCE